MKLAFEFIVRALTHLFFSNLHSEELAF
jgi:hypothetical protein